MTATYTKAAVRRPDAALGLILTVAFMVVLDFSIVNVALAAIERELHAGATSVQWVITAYAITFGGLLVLGGRMGDLWGRRRMFVVGLLLFSFASLLGGLAGDLGMLVAARALQGVGAAIVAPAALSLITTSVPEGPARTRALGYYGATASIGFVAGLVLGGVLVQFFDWRAVLWVNVPIGLAAALLTPLLVPAAAPAARRHRLDVGGALLVTGSVAAAVYGISEGPVAGWVSTRTVGMLLVAIVLGATFLVVERRHPAPLVRLGIARLALLRTANLYAVLLGAWSAGELLVVPLYLQLVLHYSPLLTGVAMAPQGVAGFLGATRGPGVVRRVGMKTFLVVSATAAAGGLLLLGLALASRSYPLLLTGLVLAGYGTSTGSFGATVAATQGVVDGEQGLAGGLINMSRQVGAALGVAVAAAVIGTGATSGASLTPDRAALMATAAAGALAVVLTLRGVKVRDRVAASSRLERPRRPLPGRSGDEGDPGAETASEDSRTVRSAA
jgi:EmrB/QacA subfamily drug resistance transporter